MCKIYLKFVFCFEFAFFFFYSSPASAQKVLQCSPGTATVNNNLVVNGSLSVNNRASIATVNPQITLAVGDNDTGLQWNSDGNFSLYTNYTGRISIDSAGDVNINNRLCLGGTCLSSWPSSPTITLTGDVTGSGTTSIATTIPSGTIAWGELSSIPAGFVDNTDDGITSVPNCGANQKLTGSGGSPICANDLDTDTDAQTLSIAGSTLSISGGNNITLPATSLSGSGTDNFITKWTGASTLGSSLITDGGAQVTISGNVDFMTTGNTILGDGGGTDNTTVNGKIAVRGGPNYTSTSTNITDHGTRTFTHNLNYIPWCLWTSSNENQVVSIRFISTTDIVLYGWSPSLGQNTNVVVYCW